MFPQIKKKKKILLIQSKHYKINTVSMRDNSNAFWHYNYTKSLILYHKRWDQVQTKQQQQQNLLSFHHSFSLMQVETMAHTMTHNHHHQSSNIINMLYKELKINYHLSHNKYWITKDYWNCQEKLKLELYPIKKKEEDY